MNRLSSSIKTVAVNATLTLATLCVAFALGEFVVRMFFKDLEESVLFPRYQTDYRYGRYTLRGNWPNAEFWHTSIDGSWRFVTNSRGFRDTREFDYGKTAGSLRVLALGDSQTQGYEVRQDQTYAAVLERFLGARGIAAEAINAGVSGFSTAEALAYLEAEGHKYSPDVVVLGFYANDFQDNLKAGLFELDASGVLVERSYEHTPGVGVQKLVYSVAPLRWLSENSYFYSLLFNKTWLYFKQRFGRLARGAAAQPEYAVAKRSGPTPVEVALAAALIERMQRFCAERGIRLVVVDIPMLSRPYRFVSSFPPALLDRMRAARVEHVSTDAFLADLNGAATVHVPHGQHHISELTHTLIGVELGRRISTLNQKDYAPAHAALWRGHAAPQQ